MLLERQLEKSDGLECHSVTQIQPGYEADPGWQQGHPYLQLIPSLTGDAITTWQFPECPDGGGEGKGALPSVFMAI